MDAQQAKHKVDSIITELQVQVGNLYIAKQQDQSSNYPEWKRCDGAGSGSGYLDSAHSLILHGAHEPCPMCAEKESMKRIVLAIERLDAVLAPLKNPTPISGAKVCDQASVLIKRLRSEQESLKVLYSELDAKSSQQAEQIHQQEEQINRNNKAIDKLRSQLSDEQQKARSTAYQNSNLISQLLNIRKAFKIPEGAHSGLYAERVMSALSKYRKIVDRVAEVEEDPTYKSIRSEARKVRESHTIGRTETTH